MIPEDILPLLVQDEIDPDVVVAKVQEYACPSHIGQQVLLHLLAGIREEGPRNRAETIAALVEACGASPFDEEHTVNGMYLGLQQQVLRALHTREQNGQGIRTEEGGNVLHHLVNSHSAFTLHYLVAARKPLSGFMCPQWAGQAQANGKTPLHLLWQRAITSLTTERNFWATVEGLMDHGARLDQPDNSGMTVLDLIDMARRSQPHLFDPLDVREISAMDKVMSHLHHRELDQATPSASVARNRRF